jgi:hypothetical protein
MTEELEKKLNELLGLKKQLEEITEEKQKTFTTSVLERYRKEHRLNVISFLVKCLLGMALISFGLIIWTRIPGGVINIDCPTIIVSGIVILILAKLGWRINTSKLAILEEMKQFELRMTEMLKR